MALTIDGRPGRRLRIHVLRLRSDTGKGISAKNGTGGQKRSVCTRGKKEMCVLTASSGGGKVKPRSKGRKGADRKGRLREGLFLRNHDSSRRTKADLGRLHIRRRFIKTGSRSKRSKQILPWRPDAKGTVGSADIASFGIGRPGEGKKGGPGKERQVRYLQVCSEADHP